MIAGKKSKWVTVFLWLVVTVLLSAFAPSVSKVENNNAALLPSNSFSVQAQAIIQKDFPNHQGTPALIVFYDAHGLTQADVTSIQKASKAVALHKAPGQTSVIPFYAMPKTAFLSLASKDHTTFVMPVFFSSSLASTSLQSSIKSMQNTITKALLFNPFTASITTQGLHARVSGPVGIAADALGLFKGADVTLLIATTMLVLVLLIILYRSPILAFVPLLSVGVAYGVISSILGLLAKHGVIVVDAQGISIMTVLLFGAGTDYCLFLVARYRERLLQEQDSNMAINLALRKTASAILMSALTVMLALLALLFARYGSDHRFAIPFFVAILVMAAVGLTFVPALLAILGRWAFFPFIPRVGQKHARTRFSFGAFVVKRPRTIAIGATLLLIVLGSFATQIHFTYNLLSSFPSTMPSREGYTILAKHFSPGTLAPVEVVTQGGNATVITKTLTNLPFVQSVSQPTTSPKYSNRLAFEVTLNKDPYSMSALNDIPKIREALTNKVNSSLPQSLWIGGETSTQYDTQALTNADTKVVIPIVITIIAILLLVYLRSIVAMVYLIITVLLSYASALGLGWIVLHNIMGVQAIAGAIPLYAFVFLVALGEDYNIFMVSRIWQESRHMPLKDAVELGVNRTGGVITSAGLILAGTFAVLATLPIQILVQFGIVTAIGVLLDTFIVRPFLVPAITILVAKAAFWPSRRPIVND